VPGKASDETDAAVRNAVQTMPPETAVFVHGVLGSTGSAAKEIAQAAKTRRVLLASGTSLAVAWRLPEVDVAPGQILRQGLIVVQGGQAGLDGLDGLLPLIEKRRGGESAIDQVRFYTGARLWQAAAEGIWASGLLAAALSRSDSPQGDPATDGRTQDLVKLGLVQKLAHDPHAWVVDHQDGFRSTILVLDGVVADYNFAVIAADGTIISAQLFRPPKPARHEFSRLAAAIEDFFRKQAAPWNIERSLLTAELLERFGQAKAEG
jgi:hypothetical protein